MKLVSSFLWNLNWCPTLKRRSSLTRLGGPKSCWSHYDNLVDRPGFHSECLSWIGGRTGFPFSSFHERDWPQLEWNPKGSLRGRCRIIYKLSLHLHAVYTIMKLGFLIPIGDDVCWKALGWQDASLLFNMLTNVHSVLICMHLNCDIAKCRLALPTGTGGGSFSESLDFDINSKCWEWCQDVWGGNKWACSDLPFAWLSLHARENKLPSSSRLD